MIETRRDEWGILRPVSGCGAINPRDGLCAHPSNPTPECHCEICPLVPPNAPECGQCLLCEEPQE